MILGKFERVIHISYKLSTVLGELSTVCGAFKGVPEEKSLV
jgi:hypothetical protein